MFLNILFHPHNKHHDLPTLKTKFTLSELLDYKESLDIMSEIEKAMNKDAENKAKREAATTKR